MNLLRQFQTDLSGWCFMILLKQSLLKNKGEMIIIANNI
jgi:hypothetical protein